MSELPGVGVPCPVDFWINNLLLVISLVTSKEPVIAESPFLCPVALKVLAALPAIVVAKEALNELVAKFIAPEMSDSIWFEEESTPEGNVVVNAAEEVV